MSHDFLFLFGAIAAWIGALEYRLMKSNKKIAKIDQETKDAKIKSDMHLLSDSKLDAVLTKDLSGSNTDH